MGLLGPLSRSFIFYPTDGPVDSASRIMRSGRDVVLHTEDGLDLGAWLFPPTADDRGQAVLFAPGNGGDRAGRAALFVALAERGFTVLAMDYRGYGGNPGSPSEDGLAADAQAAVALLRAEGFGPERTIYLGESMGTAVVSRLSSTDPPAAIALRSPFPSLAEVAKHLFSWLPVDAILQDRFEAISYLREVHVPVSVIRGTADSIVPNALSAEVAAAVPVLHEDLELPGVEHNDLVMIGPVVADAVTRLADRAAARP